MIPEARKGGRPDSPEGARGRTRPCRHLGFSPGRPGGAADLRTVGCSVCGVRSRSVPAMCCRSRREPGHAEGARFRRPASPRRASFLKGVISQFVFCSFLAFQ